MHRLIKVHLPLAKLDELFAGEYNSDRTQYPEVFEIDPDYNSDSEVIVDDETNEAFVIERDEDGDIIDGDYHEAFRDEDDNLFIVDSEYDFMF